MSASGQLRRIHRLISSQNNRCAVITLRHFGAATSAVNGMIRYNQTTTGVEAITAARGTRLVVAARSISAPRPPHRIRSAAATDNWLFSRRDELRLDRYRRNGMMRRQREQRWDWYDESSIKLDVVDSSKTSTSTTANQILRLSSNGSGRRCHVAVNRWGRQ